MRKSSVDVREFTTAQEMLDYLRPSARHWVDDDGVNRYIYRGVWNSEWPLLPSAWREPAPDFFLAIRDFICRFRIAAQAHFSDDTKCPSWVSRPTNEDERDRLLSRLMHFAAECECVRRFADFANELGLFVPAHEVENAESFLSGKFSSFAAGWLGGPQPQMEAIHGLAQHHGIPTRLLDWTYRPSHAAYFAVCPEGRKGWKRPEPPKTLGVWALRYDQAHKHETKDGLTMLTLNVPRHSNNFLHAQDGLFTWLDGADRYYQKYDKWPCLEEVVSLEAHSGTSLRLCTLPTTEADELLTRLWQERVSRAHLMPTFDNVTRGLEHYVAVTKMRRSK